VHSFLRTNKIGLIIHRFAEFLKSKKPEAVLF
jgi:hypothetical protein